MVSRKKSEVETSAEIPVGREVDVAPLWRDPLSPPMFCNLAMNERRHEQTTREEVT